MGSRIITGVLVSAAIIFGVPFMFFLRPVAATDTGKVYFEVRDKEGFLEISKDLASSRLVRSRLAFELYALLSVKARQLKPGTYELTPAMSTPEITRRLYLGIDREATATVPEGASALDIDSILASAGVLPAGKFLEIARRNNLEGYLFPDTYRFYLDANPEDVLAKFADNFKIRLAPLLPADQKKARDVLILASILEKEVATDSDRKLVAGILLKRLEAGMSLQVDATLCYVKREKNGQKPCYPITPLDTRIESPYNTYLHKGLPPGPIGNPGISAVLAVLSPVKSPYWYYISDPVTKQTIFAKTLAEQNANTSKHLENPTH